ncbi:hypothetical protein A33Q_0640 [Indibacter alkaliphilus LW1]|uniref:Uncharacterized protein n=1 Tax=Indibacter alkaliphilus (strain CCUG 57479 / KCTC 22604 / LW1) TaxID=1189612 RepID=S2DJX8_INDAL|nr:hypothetical protein A33Q_0640 [Indibacter alkaliphilus LW1]
MAFFMEMLGNSQAKSKADLENFINFFSKVHLRLGVDK